MSGLNWNKTRKFREYEEKYIPGTVMDNGRVISDRPRDQLAARAAKAEEQWLLERAEKAKERRQRRRAAKKAKKQQEPTRGQMKRLGAIREQLGLPDD
jgi:hypothetical protein